MIPTMRSYRLRLAATVALVFGLMATHTAPALAAPSPGSRFSHHQVVRHLPRNRRGIAHRQVITPSRIVVHGVRVSGKARALLHDPVWLHHEAILLRSAEHKIAKQAHRNLQKIAVFGSVVAVYGHVLLIHKIAPVGAPSNARLVHVDPEPEVGDAAGDVRVQVESGADVQVPGGLAGLSVGMPLLVGGSLLPHRAMSAHLVADLRRAQVPPPALHVGHGHVVHLRSTGVGPSSSPTASTFRPMDINGTQYTGAGTLEFQGQFGGPSIYAVEPLNATFLDSGGYHVVLTQMVFDAALAGWSYDFPFAFTGSASTLAINQQSTVNLTVTPKTPASSTQPTFIGGFGISYDFTFQITAGGSTYTHDVPVSFLTLTNTSFDPPPAQGATWTVPATNCPSATIGIPNVPLLNAFEMEFCFDYKFTGTPFIADVTATNATVGAASRTCQRLSGTTSPCFDGVNPTSFSVTPSANPVTLTLKNFEYTPTSQFDLNLVFKAGACPLLCGTLASVGPFTLQQGAFYGITTPFPYNSDFFLSTYLSGGQPSSASMTFATAPSVTGLGPNWGYAHYNYAPYNDFGDDTTIIEGAGFSGANALDFGSFGCAIGSNGTMGTCGTVLNDNQIEAEIPPSVTNTARSFHIAVEVPQCTGCGNQLVSPVSGADVFTVVQPPPQIGAVTPNRGPLAGGNAVTITGEGLQHVTKVEIGGTSIGSFTVDSDSQITIPSMPGVSSARTLPIWVDADCSGSNSSALFCGSSSSTAGPQNSYSYLGTPDLTVINPDRGPASGGNSVVLDGFGFTTATSVEAYDGQQWQPLPFTVTNDDQITISSMPDLGVTGPVQVRVTTDCTGSNVSTATSCGTSNTYEYRFLPRPIMTSLSQTSGPLAGGNSLVITGSGFTSITEVHIAELALGPGDTPSSFTIDSNHFTVDSDAQLTIPSMPAPPYGYGGPVTISLTAGCLTPATANATACGTSVDQTSQYSAQGYDYTFTPAPTISISVSPPAGQSGYFNASNLPATGTVTAQSSGQAQSLSCIGATLSNLSGASTHTVTGSLSLSTEGANTITCTATDAQGDQNQASTTVLIDTTPPTIMASFRDVNGNPISPNANGWFNQTVVVHFTCTDTLSGVATCPADVTLTSEGQNQIVSGTAYDKAGNPNSSSVSVSIDKTAPTLSPLVSPNPVLPNGTAAATPNASDPLSGVASQSCAAPTTTTAGAQTVTCTATDNAGNTATASGSYQVQYASAGATCDGAPGHQVLPPINGDGSSTFKLGSTVPIKFRVCDANGSSVGPTAAQPTVVASFRQTAVNANPSAVVNETPVSTTPDMTFRWDSTDQQWIFNLDTSNLVGGDSYTYQIGLVDGTTITVSFSVK